MITRTQKSNTIKLVATTKSPNSADEKDKVYQKGGCKMLNTFFVCGLPKPVSGVGVT